MSLVDTNARVLTAMATHKKHLKHHKVKDSDDDIPQTREWHLLSQPAIS